jgi:hypothetical protein
VVPIDKRLAMGVDVAVKFVSDAPVQEREILGGRRMRCRLAASGARPGWRLPMTCSAASSAQGRPCGTLAMSGGLARIALRSLGRGQLSTFRPRTVTVVWCRALTESIRSLLHARCAYVHLDGVRSRAIWVSWT